jgi:hypothetical protein
VRRTYLSIALTACLGMHASGCGDDLGSCDRKAAQELVYGPGEVVATKGQALMHDSCGQAAFCHSSAAKGKARQGTPAGLNFDMLPRPTGVGKVLHYREPIWQQILDGEMPPDNYHASEGQWFFDIERTGKITLPSLKTRDGKGALRNWLACGAPVVVDSKVPEWAVTSDSATDPASQEWTSLHHGLQKGCVKGGCHDGSLDDATRLSGALTVPFAADPCTVYRWLLFNRGACDERLVVGGDLADSMLVHKLEDAAPKCGDPMPPDGSKVDPKLVESVRTWISHGAFAPQCGEWSDSAPRVSDFDAGAGELLGWKELHAQIIVPRCAFGGCHDSAGAHNAGGLDLSDVCGSADALGKKGSCGEVRVRAGDASSLLVRKLESGSQSCGTAMPPPTGGLPQTQIEQIKVWVVNGAEPPAECK